MCLLAEAAHVRVEYFVGIAKIYGDLGASPRNAYARGGDFRARLCISPESSKLKTIATGMVYSRHARSKHI